MEMVNAISDTAIGANVRANFEVFRQTFEGWRQELIRWRCSLPEARVTQLRRSLAGWDCRDVQFFITELPFDQLDPDRIKQLSDVPTRFKLSREQVDLAIRAGREVLQRNEVFRRFLTSLPSDGHSARQDPLLAPASVDRKH
jgi:NTE family protein